VRSRFIVVANVIFQNLTQMSLAQDNDVVGHLRRIDPISRSAKPLLRRPVAEGIAHGC
jgi:hypothetical protein